MKKKRAKPKCRKEGKNTLNGLSPTGSKKTKKKNNKLVKKKRGKWVN